MRNIFKLFEKITEIIGWMQIAISSALLSFGLGCVVYLIFHNTTGLILGILILIIGLIGGVLFATKKIKTTGTIDLLSRVNATPELDKKVEPELSKKPKEENKS